MGFAIENNLIEGKIFAEIGNGYFSVAISVAKMGAKRVIEVNINPKTIENTKINARKNNVADKILFVHGKNINAFISANKTDIDLQNNKIDVLYAALPWDYISQEEFSKMPDERKLMGHAFYDIENKVFSSILQHGFDLLSEDGIILP